MQPKGSDSCAYEMMEDSQADEIQMTCAKMLKEQKLPRMTYGMDNLGNTCFFNAVMQCLTHTVPFHIYCLSRAHNKNSTEKSGRYSFQDGYVKFIKDMN